MNRLLGIPLVLALIAPTIQATASDDPLEPGTDPGSVGTAVTGIGLKIYANEMREGNFRRLSYGYDRDEVCTRGFCDNGTTVCLSDAVCTGIGSGLCNYTACGHDFDVCDDGVTICADNAGCSGIGSGTCNSNPCAPPNEICGVKVDSLMPGAPREQTIWELVCDPTTLPAGTDCQVGKALPDNVVSWDFSSINPTNYPGVYETATTYTPIDSTQTPNYAECGFNPGGAFPERQLNREDKNWPDPSNVVPTLQSSEMTLGVCDDGTGCNDDTDCPSGTCSDDATIWMRGVVRFEGIDSPDLGAGESRLCHIEAGRTEIPLYRFRNFDGGGAYMDLDDSWTQIAPFACEPIILFPAAVNAEPQGNYSGTMSGEVVNEGVVKLPSGHQLKSLVVRSVTEYGVGILACLIDVDQVRTVIYLWQVPHIGTVVRLQSDKIAGPTPGSKFTFTHLSETDVKYGLFPPLSVTVGAVGGSSVDLSWDPGLITDHISGYRIYWDTESGGRCSLGGEDCNADHPGVGNECLAGFTCCSTPGAVCDGYDFDSLNDPGFVTFNTATSATISGLDPSTTYHFTVTALSDYTDPATSSTRTYESLLYPTQVPAVPIDLPVEVAATTLGGGTKGAVPDGGARPGTPLTIAKGPGSSITLTWGASCVASDTDYGVYEGVLGDYAGHDRLTCSTGGTMAQVLPGGGSRFYLVVPNDAGAEGSYGLDSSGAERVASPAACHPQVIGDPVCN